MRYSGLLFITLILCPAYIVGQKSTLSQIAIIQEQGNWIEILPDHRIDPEGFFAEFQDDLGLDHQYHFELINKKSDLLGFEHQRYQQYFKGHPIEGGGYILHVKDGFVSHANGEIVRGIPGGSPAGLTAHEGLSLAKDYMGAALYYWEVPGMEERIKYIQKDPSATFYPQAELVYAQKNYERSGKDYALAWKYEIYSAQPDGKETVFVDASSGEVLFALEGCQHGSVEGEANTRYHGTRTIIADSISSTEYKLIDATRGGGVETYDMNEEDSDFSSAIDFLDEDNFWDNANIQFDEAATDAHWGSEQSYDYFLNEHGRDSYDDEGSVIISYVHVGENWFNASWNGMFMQYGDGNGNPLTAIDVVAHELTHGVTGNSAGLIYQNESGALNESFSDIFGTAVEHYALGEEAEWVLGSANFVLRDLSDPNAYGDPDTYQGMNYWNSAGDNGGVHTNSGVQNFWFYLLSNGGTGVNDNGDEYIVDSLGMEKAAAIAYRNLTTYLMPGSNYTDARIGSIQAAEDLYGTCSYEVLQVAKAWYAVGIGGETITPDLQVIEVLSPLFSNCDLGAAEPMAMAFRFNPSGCGFTLDAGAEIEVSYQINAQDPIVESIVLTETLSEGELVLHEFQTPADLSEVDQYFLDYTVNYSEDLTPGNNEIDNHKVSNPYTFPGSSVLAFEHFNAKDSIYVVERAHSEAGISSSAENTGSKGFLMNSFGASVDNVTVIETEAENFSANVDFKSELCMCVDLSGWEEAYLNFDLRQTYSEVYLNDLGLDIDYMIALRVTADNQQIGEQYHPASNYSDPYLTHVMDMSDYAGTSFTLCFEAMNFLNEDEDDGNEGDKATLDNIFFTQSEPLGVEEHARDWVHVYPNPSSGLFYLETDGRGTHDVLVLDLLGNVVQSHRWNANGTPYTVDLSNLAKGSYFISIRSEEFTAIQKILLE